MTLITTASASVSLLPLSLHLVVDIVDDIAFFHATHTFWNNSAKNLDRAAFTFPLPAGCAVSDFACDFGHHDRFRSLISKVQPRNAARSAFEQSAQAKRPTGLLEQNSTEAFTSTIGNIASHGRLQTHLTYFGYLRSTLPDKGSSTLRNLTLTIPSSIAKRYGVPPPEFQSSSGQPLAPNLTEYNIHVHHPGHATFTSNRKIQPRWSTSAASWLVHYARVHSPPGDFELCITSGYEYHPDEGQAFFEATDGTVVGNQFAMMITIPPKQTGNTEPRAAESDIIFLADRSGSMQDKIGALKKAMNVFLKGIPTNRRFNIWCFGSEYRSIWSSSVEYNADTLKQAEDKVSGWRANMGGTELLLALQAVDSSLDPMAMVDIIVLTDGEVWALDSVVHFVKQRTEASFGRMRFFALGIGTEVSHGLVEGIAKYGGGYSEVIEGTNPTIYAERLNAMLRAANAKHVNSIQVEVDGTLLSQSTNVFQPSEELPLSPPATLSSPADLSKIGGFTRTRLFLMYDGPAFSPTSLIGTSPREVRIKEVDPLGHASSTSIPVSTIPNNDGRNLLHKAAARALLGDLEFRESWIQMHPSAPPAGSDQEIELTRHHGEELGCTWGLVSKWTSFYVVETASGPSNLGDRFLDNSDQKPNKRSKNKYATDKSNEAYEKKKSSSETTTKVRKQSTNYQPAHKTEEMKERDDYLDPEGSVSGATASMSENNGLGPSQHCSPMSPAQDTCTEATRADTWAESYNAPSSLASQNFMSLDTAPETCTDFPSTYNSNVDGNVFYGDSAGTSTRVEHPTTPWEQDFATPYQPHEYMDSTSQPNQQYPEPYYSTLKDQVPTEPEPVVRDDLNIRVPSSVLCHPPTLSAMLDVSSKRQDRKKDEEIRKYKKEFDMAMKIIKIGKWDGSFEPKDVRSLLDKHLFDGIAKSLKVLDDGVLIATIAVLIVLDDERYLICNEMLGPLEEKAKDFVWKMTAEDEGYFNKVFDSARGGYVLKDEPPWKQPQTQNGYPQEGDDKSTAELGSENFTTGTSHYGHDQSQDFTLQPPEDHQSPCQGPSTPSWQNYRTNQDCTEPHSDQYQDHLFRDVTSHFGNMSTDDGTDQTRPFQQSYPPCSTAPQFQSQAYTCSQSQSLQPNPINMDSLPNPGTAQDDISEGYMQQMPATSDYQVSPPLSRRHRKDKRVSKEAPPSDYHHISAPSSRHYRKDEDYKKDKGVSKEALPSNYRTSGSTALQFQSQAYPYSHSLQPNPINTDSLPNSGTDDVPSAYMQQMLATSDCQPEISPRSSRHYTKYKDHRKNKDYKKDKGVSREAAPSDYSPSGHALADPIPQESADPRHAFEGSVLTRGDGYQSIPSAQEGGHVYAHSSADIAPAQSHRRGKRRDSVISAEQSNPSILVASDGNATTGDATGYTGGYAGYQPNSYREAAVSHSWSSAEFGVLLDGKKVPCEGKRSTSVCLVSRDMVKKLGRDNIMDRFEEEMEVSTWSKSPSHKAIMAMATIDLDWRELNAGNVEVNRGSSRFYVCRKLPKNLVYLT